MPNFPTIVYYCVTVTMPFDIIIIPEKSNGNDIIQCGNEKYLHYQKIYPHP